MQHFQQAKSTEEDHTPTSSNTGCTLAAYANAKGLPVQFLKDLGLSGITYMQQPAVRMPYFGVDGSDIAVAVRFRVSLGTPGKAGGTGNSPYKWKTGSKITPYGLDRLLEARKAGHVTLCKGESDAQTLWYHGEPALGLPGASSWREQWADYLESIPIIYVLVEAGAAGEAMLKWLAASRIRERVRLVRLPNAKDANELHLQDKENFTSVWQEALSRAVPYVEFEKAARVASTEKATALCKGLAHEPHILDRFAADLARRGVVGESRAAKLLFLVITSRLLPQPISAVLKAPSGAGKSFLLERTIEFFPNDACYSLTGMSERALAYSDEPLAHRILLVYEGAGLAGETTSYLMRTLLSEGRIRYETVEKTARGLKPRLIEREGPTGLLLTTTSTSLHPENETRMLSIPISDSQEQTKRVLLALANEDYSSDSDAEEMNTVNMEEWHALQVYLTGAEHRVTIPYATRLADLVPPVAVRLRRDFRAVLNLVRTHAMLHQATRERDSEGRIIATPDDYRVVRELVLDLVSEGVDASTGRTIRETVEAVKAVLKKQATATVNEVAAHLKLDKSATSRRIRVALERGYLANQEVGKGKPFRLCLGAMLPDDVEILPPCDKLFPEAMEALQAAEAAGCDAAS